MIISSSAFSSLRRNFPGEPIQSEPGSTTARSGISVPAAMIDHAAVQGNGMAHGDVLADRDPISIFHAVQHAAILNVRVRADADCVDVAAQDGAHPDRGVLAEDDVANDLRRVVDVATRGNCRRYSLKGPDHPSLRLDVRVKNKYYQ